MTRYNVPLQENGRMILPAALRRQLGVGKGDKVVILADGDRLELTTIKAMRRRSQEIVRKAVPEGYEMVDALIADRREESQGDEHEAGHRAEKTHIAHQNRRSR